MTARNFALGGAALLIAGLFAPIITLPILGSINLFNNASNETAIIIVVLAAAAAWLAVREHTEDAIWPGFAAGAILLYVFARIQYGLSKMRASLTEGLEGNPFAGLAQTALGSVQLQWGWLVLAAGAGLIIYAGAKARRDNGISALQLADTRTRIVAGLSAVLLLVPPVLDLAGQNRAGLSMPGGANASDSSTTTSAPSVTDDARGPTREEATYIADNLLLYDLDAKYYDSMLDGRVPGVRFKIKNNGNRTLNEVAVRVVFYDRDGNAIAEEEYHPVLVSEYNFSGNNTPLRPNYIWQEERGRFYAAKNVPTEWKTGSAKATIIDIEFGPDE